MSKLNWEGIYTSRSAIPFAVDTLDSQSCVVPSIKHAKRLKKDAGIYHKDSLLPILTATLSGSKKIGILDYGGGLGFTYLQLVQSCSLASRLKFHVVETPSLCQAGDSFFATDDHIRFHSDIPKHEIINIVHARSVLQYIDELDQVIKQLVALCAKHILLEHLSAGDIPNYFTIQKYHGKKIPYRYLNFNKLMSKFKGYEMVYKAKSQLMDQSNFPEKYRIGHTCNVLLKRSS